MSNTSFTLILKTLGVILDEAAQKYPSNTAVVYADQVIRQTWAELKTEADTVAKGLMSIGVRPGEKIALWATSDPRWLTVMFAAAKIGAILVPINTSYRKKELSYLLQQSACEYIIVSNGYRDHNFISQLYETVPTLEYSSNSLINDPTLPSLRRVFFLGSTEYEGITPLDEIMESSRAISDEDYQKRQDSINPDDVVNMQYTSGTTGFPKGVMLTHTNIVNNGYWIGKNQNFTNHDIICLPVPLFHCFGSVLGVMACVNHGATMIIPEVFQPRQALSLVEKERCTGLYGVPSMFLSMIEHKTFSSFDLSSLRTGIMAGSVCPEPLLRRIVEHMHMPEITVCYGLTEASPVITQTGLGDDFVKRTATVGKALPGVEVKIVDPDTQEELPAETAGEVICRGYNIMKGYYAMEKETQRVISANGWLRTGDLGILRNDGYLVITGRIKDMIVRAGENIYPIEIEEFLSGMKEIFDIQVVGVPSRKYGEEVAAFIIVKHNAILTEEAIRSYCRGRISWTKVPRYFAFVKEYPLTASGKIQKYKLRQTAELLFAKHDSSE